MERMIKWCNNRLMELLLAAEDREHRTSQRQENTSIEELSLRDGMEESSVEFSHYPHGIIQISFRMVGKVYYHI